MSNADAFTPARIAIVATLAFAALAVLVLAPIAGAPSQVAAAGALLVFTIGLWATGAVAEHVAALFFFVVASVFAIGPPDVVFSGFASNAMWLVFGGMVIGVGVGRSGLARWLAARVVGERVTGYRMLVVVLVSGTVVLGFLVPSATGRAVILMPIVLVLADEIGFAPGRPGRTGLVLAVALANFYVPSGILPGNLTNVLLAGAADSLYGITLTYGEYFLMQFPFNGLAKGVLVVLVIWWRYPDEIPAGASAARDRAPLGRDGKRMLALVLLALALWMTDTVHGVPPGWVATGIGLLCLLPGTTLVPPKDFRDGVSLATILYVAGVLGMGALVADSGLGALFAEVVMRELALEGTSTAHGYATISLLTYALSFFATNAGAIAIVAPLTADAAAATGASLETLLMAIAIGFSMPAFPYQAAPMLIAVKLGNATIAEALRATIPIALASLVLLVPVNYAWWRLLGYL